MPDRDQIFIYNAEELSLLKNTFADNDTLLYVIRKVFLQFPVTETEQGLLRLALSPEVIRVLRKTILPEVGPEYPLGQLPSLITTITKDIQSRSPEDMVPLFRAKQLELDFLAQQFTVLENPEAPQPIKLKDLEVLDFVNTTAYLFILGYLDQRLIAVKSLAGVKEETPEEQAKRLTRDSSK